MRPPTQLRRVCPRVQTMLRTPAFAVVAALVWLLGVELGPGLHMARHGELGHHHHGVGEALSCSSHEGDGHEHHASAGHHDGAEVGGHHEHHAAAGLHEQRTVAGHHGHHALGGRHEHHAAAGLHGHHAVAGHHEHHGTAGHHGEAEPDDHQAAVEHHGTAGHHGAAEHDDHATVERHEHRAASHHGAATAHGHDHAKPPHPHRAKPHPHRAKPHPPHAKPHPPERLAADATAPEAAPVAVPLLTDHAPAALLVTNPATLAHAHGSVPHGAGSLAHRDLVPLTPPLALPPILSAPWRPAEVAVVFSIDPRERAPETQRARGPPSGGTPEPLVLA